VAEVRAAPREEGTEGPESPAGPSGSGSRRLVVVLAAVAVLGIGAVVGLVVRAGGDGDGPAAGTLVMAGAGMEPTLSDGDPVPTRAIESGDEVGRGDVVVVRAPAADGAGSMLVVKRVVAVAGDEIAMVPSTGVFLIDGEPADEPYLAPHVVTTSLDTQEVPAGHVFVLGDNRPNSVDSRRFGPVPDEDVVALVDLG
jgi:signal peptidase I